MIEFVARLKQRKVVQWSIAYVAFAFSLIQVIDIVAGSYEWSHLVMHLVFGTLALGFIVALLLAWYHGERRAQRISGPELLLIALALGIGGGLLWHFGKAGSTATPIAARGEHVQSAAVANSSRAKMSVPGTGPSSSSPPARAGPMPAKSIAVLPFKSLSADPDNAYFAAGIQDLILTKLVDIGNLRVISRTSTERYARHPADVRTIARELGAATILEGSIQKAGNTVLVNVQLIDARTDQQLWAESYTRALGDVFGVEGEVAQRVAVALKTHLDAAEIARAEAVPTSNPEAYDLFLQAVSLLNSGNYDFDLEKMRRSFPLFAKALAADPKFALALARWSYGESVVASLSQGGDAPELHGSARRHAQQALSLQPEMAAAMLAMGYSNYLGRQDYPQALQLFDAVLKTHPNYIEAMDARALVVRRTGHMAEALRELQSALALDQGNPLVVADAAETAGMLRRYDEAARMFRLALAQGANTGWARMLFAQSIVCAGGDLGEATSVVQGDEPVMRLQRVWLLTLQRKWDAALGLLEGVPDLPENFVLLYGPKEVQTARLYRYAGDTARARALYGRALPGLRARARAPGNGIPSGWLLTDVAEAELGTGDPRAAVASAQAALVRIRSAGDHVHGPIVAVRAAAVLAQAQRADLALPVLERELATEGTGLVISPALLRIDPAWDPIRNDPRFLALLKKYPAPLSPSVAAIVPASAAAELAYDD